MTGERIGLLVNPVADHGRARRTGAATAAALRAAGTTVVDLTADSDTAALKRAIAARSSLDALVVVGGDGVVHLGVNVVAGTDLPLGIVPAGSGNDFAHAVGLRPVRRSLADAVARLLTFLTDPTPIDAIRLTLGAAAPVWVAGAVSVGIDAAVNARANTYRWPHGQARYLRAIAAEVATGSVYGYRVTTDAGVWTSPGMLALASNIPRLGGGIRLAPHARPDDGMLDVVLASGLSRLATLAILPRLALGRHLSHPAVTHMRSREILIEQTHAGRTAPPVHGDGERLGALPARAVVVPGAVRLLVAPLPLG